MSDIRPETKFQGSIPPETSDFILPKAFKAPNQVNKLQFQLDLTSSTPQLSFLFTYSQKILQKLIHQSLIQTNKQKIPKKSQHVRSIYIHCVINNTNIT